MLHQDTRATAKRITIFSLLLLTITNLTNIGTKILAYVLTTTMSSRFTMLTVIQAGKYTTAPPTVTFCFQIYFIYTQIFPFKHQHITSYHSISARQMFYIMHTMAT